MLPPTLLDLTDVPGCPRVKLVLPVPMRLGDRVRLAFKLRRQNGGRSEVLEVNGDFRVQSAHLSVEHQSLSVEALGKAPAWKAVRREGLAVRRLPPARFPPTTPI